MSAEIPLVVFSDDWGRHPSSCQHLIRELLPRHEVIWINTIGTRPPRFDAYTVRRGLSKLAGWIRPNHDTVVDAPAPKIIKPLMWPSFGSRAARSLNRRLLANRIRKELRGREAVFITTVPIVADLIGAVPAKRWVYYCVDDFSVWPGLDGDTLRVLEAKLISRVDRAVAASGNLQRRISTQERTATLLTHGVDLAFWRDGSGSTSLLDGMEPPFVLFWGLIDPRLNVAWLSQLSESMSTGTIVLVGPRQDVDSRLARLERVRLLGRLPFSDLPALAAKASVLVMPYADLAVTRAMQPLKFKEYLATGKPVVAARLPALEEWFEAADLVADETSFVDAVKRRLAGGVDDAQLAARRRLDRESWAAKAETFVRLCLEDAA